MRSEGRLDFFVCEKTVVGLNVINEGFKYYLSHILETVFYLSLSFCSNFSGTDCQWRSRRKALELSLIDATCRSELQLEGKR